MQVVKLFRQAHLHCLNTQPLQHLLVLEERALQSQNTYLHLFFTSPAQQSILHPAARKY